MPIYQNYPFHWENSFLAMFLEPKKFSNENIYFQMKIISKLSLFFNAFFNSQIFSNENISDLLNFFCVI